LLDCVGKKEGEKKHLVNRMEGKSIS